MAKVIDLSIAIPYHGDRLKWTQQTVLNVHNRNFVREIIITVDPSEYKTDWLRIAFQNYPKVKIFENEKRLFVFRNKINAVQHCKGEWVALIDSDNVIGSVYLGPLLKGVLDRNTIYCPEIGFPALVYSKFVGLDIDLNEATSLIGDNQYDMLINTMNYVFHRETWLNALKEAIDSDYEPITADSAWINYNCMKHGMNLNIMKGTSYKHTVHGQSTYLLHQDEGVAEYAKICEVMKGLRDENLGSSRKIQARKSDYISKASNITATGGSSGKLVQEKPEGHKNKSGLLTD